MDTNHSNLICGYTSEHFVTHQSCIHSYTGDRRQNCKTRRQAWRSVRWKQFWLKGWAQTEVREQGKRRKEMSQMLYCSMTFVACTCPEYASVPACACQGLSEAQLTRSLVFLLTVKSHPSPPPLQARAGAPTL